MLESNEKSHHRLPFPFPKSKDGARDNMEEDEEGEAPTAEQQEDKDSNDEEDTVDLLETLQKEFSRLSTH